MPAYARIKTESTNESFMVRKLCIIKGLSYTEIYVAHYPKTSYYYLHSNICIYHKLHLESTYHELYLIINNYELHPKYTHHKLRLKYTYQGFFLYNSDHELHNLYFSGQYLISVNSRKFVINLISTAFRNDGVKLHNWKI